jgi:hypothetical protein
MITHNFLVVGADTDGLAFKKRDEKQFTNEERLSLLAELNSIMDGMIHFEDDGVMKRQLVVKAKNYVMLDESGKVKIKGSALKATQKEKALQAFLREIIDLFLTDKKDQIFSLYFKYANDVLAIADISQWCVRKTVTKSVLNPERTNERRVLDALEESDSVEGDRVYIFNKTATELCLQENFDGSYDVDTMLRKLYNTLAIFDTILDIDLFPNFTLQRNRELLGLQKKLKPQIIKGGMTAPIPPTNVLQTRPAFEDSFWNVKGNV